MASAAADAFNRHGRFTARITEDHHEIELRHIDTGVLAAVVWVPAWDVAPLRGDDPPWCWSLDGEAKGFDLRPATTAVADIVDAVAAATLPCLDDLPPDCETPDPARDVLPGPHEATGAYRPGSLAADMAYLEQLVRDHPGLQDAEYDVYSLSGVLWVRATGGRIEAHYWHAAVGGRRFSSRINNRGVRRQMIFGTRIGVELISEPAPVGDPR